MVGHFPANARLRHLCRRTEVIYQRIFSTEKETGAGSWIQIPPRRGFLGNRPPPSKFHWFMVRSHAADSQREERFLKNEKGFWFYVDCVAVCRNANGRELPRGGDRHLPSWARAPCLSRSGHSASGRASPQSRATLADWSHDLSGIVISKRYWRSDSHEAYAKSRVVIKVGRPTFRATNKNYTRE